MFIISVDFEFLENFYNNLTRLNKLVLSAYYGFSEHPNSI